MCGPFAELVCNLTVGEETQGANGRELNLDAEWKTNPRWAGIKRPYSQQDVEQLRGSARIEHSLARLGAERLWSLLHSETYTAALGAMTGNQAVQQLAAGLNAIYVSGWQAAADANDSAQMYPDQSLYPADSDPNLVRRLNQSLLRADQIRHSEGRNEVYWRAPLVADAEAGFGGNLKAFELMKTMIEAGAALAEEPGRCHDREFPARLGRAGLQVPIHHTGRLPRTEPFDVWAGTRLQEFRHDRLLPPAG